MLSKDAVVFDSDDVVYIIRVVLSQVIEDVKFNSSLVMKSLLVSDDLDGDLFICLVVTAFKGLSKAALAQEIENLIPVDQVILQHNLVVTSVIIVTIIVLKLRRCPNLGGIQPKEIDLAVVNYLGSLILGQIIRIEL
jgi:hypothetical protein